MLLVYSTARARRDAVGAAPALVTYNLSYLYFTPPIFMGVFVGLLVVFFSFIGAYQLLITENPDRFASTSDKNLIVPAN